MFNVSQGGLYIVICRRTFACLAADPIILSSSLQQALLPVPHSLVSVFLASLPLLESFAPRNFISEVFEFLQNRSRGVNCGRDPRVIRRKLFQLALDDLVLNTLIASVHDQQRGDVVSLNLHISASSSLRLTFSLRSLSTSSRSARILPSRPSISFAS